VDADPHMLGRLTAALTAESVVDSPWTPVLGALSTVFRAHVVSYQTYDPVRRLGQIDAWTGLDASLVERFPLYVHEHPWLTAAGARLAEDGVADDEGLVTERALRDTRCFQELLAPAGVLHGMALCFHSSDAGGLALMTINRDRDEGHFSSEERALAAAFLPHLRSAYLLQQRLGDLGQRLQAFRQALDLVSDGVVLMGAAGQLVHRNRAAEAMEASGLYRLTADRHLRFCNASDTRRLGYLAERPPPAPVTFRVFAGAFQPPVIVRACAVGAIAAAQWDEPSTSLVVFLTRTAPAAASDVAWPWPFTHAERRLAQILAQGATLHRAAEALSVSHNTVRTQLRALLAKTGTNRQADLVRLLTIAGR